MADDVWNIKTCSEDCKALSCFLIVTVVLTGPFGNII